MKRSMAVSLVALILSLFLPPLAGSTLAGNPQTPDPIQSIRQQYAAINQRQGRYKKVKKELSGFSLEGGDLIAYFDGAAIVKIVANHYAEGGKVTEEYYYWNGKLIFVFRKDQRYNKPLSGKVVRTEENRFYFENDRLIRWLNETGKQVPSGADEYAQNQDEYLKTSTKFVDGVHSKNSTIEAGN
jgi:hypothetical protein